MKRTLVLCLLTACVALPEGEREAVFDRTSSGFYDTPFPSDARRTPDGGLDWTRFPNPRGNPILSRFIDLAAARAGAAHNAPIYLRFDPPLPARLLPEPDDTIHEGALVRLVDIDPSSPDFGRFVPLRAEGFSVDGTFVDPGLVAFAPIPGFPLRPNTRYALIVHRQLADASRTFTEVWGSETPWGRALRPLEDALPYLGLRRSDVAVATVFRTEDPLEEMGRIATFLRDRLPPGEFARDASHLGPTGSFDLYRTELPLPVFMSGQRPFASAGGSFSWTPEGEPVVQTFDLARVAVTVPQHEAPPPGGWPVAVYLPGTGGSYRGFASSASELGVAEWLARSGVVGLGIELILHGTRGTPDTTIDLHSFNVLQPDSALHIHRQGAADILSVLHALQQEVTLTGSDGREIPLSSERVVLVGHSQGGLSLAIALPWLGGLTKGAMISGAGGLLAITAVERDDDYDFPGLIRQALAFAPDEELTELHPALGLVQTLVDPSDPINYAPSWFRTDVTGGRAPPVPVLLTSGLRDDQTPFRTAEALAAAASMPFVGRRFSNGEAHHFRGLRDQPLPARDNAAGWAGPVTAGISQWRSGDHFVLFRDTRARDLVRTFLLTALDDVPAIAFAAPGDDAP